MEEDGSAVDGLMAKLESDFQKIGVTLYDTNGTMKSTYEIFESIAKVWDTLSLSQKQYYAELSAGKTQANVFVRNFR